MKATFWITMIVISLCIIPLVNSADYLPKCDIDGDGDVDATDLAIFSQHFGSQYTIWYLDSDGDGFGDHAVSLAQKQQPTGYVANDLDCDDSNGNVNPNVDELLGDGIDNNCNGQIDEDIPGAWITGTATVYPYPGFGACGWASTETIDTYGDMVIAVPGNLWDNGLRCGAVYEIECLGLDGDSENCNVSTVKAVVVDVCPDCPNYRLDLNTAVWQALFNGLYGGVLDINFRRIKGHFSSNIKIEVRDGSSAWWLGFCPKFSNTSITRVQIKSSGQANYDYDAVHQNGLGFWSLSGSPQLQLPLSFRFTDENNSVLEATDIVTGYSGTFDSGVNF